MKLFALALIANFAISGAAFAGGCSAPNEPVIPEGGAASASEMVKVKKEVEAYMSAANEYLECRMPRNKHNRMVAKMEKTAKKFNSLLKAGTYVYL